MKNFFTYDADGRVHGSGVCQDQDLDQQARAGLSVMEGSADCFQNYVDGQTLHLMPERPSIFHTFDYPAKQWRDERNMDQRKIAAWNNIKPRRNSAIDAPLNTPFGVFDVAKGGRTGIERATSLAEQLNAPVNFTLHDNQIVSLGFTELVQVGLMLAQREQRLRDKATALRAQIDAATTAAELDLIVW